MKIILTTEAELKDLIEATTRKVLPTVLREPSRKEWLTTDEVMHSPLPYQ